MKLTGKTVAGLALPPGKDDQIFWDGDLVGFGVRIRGSSTRQFIAQYRSGGHTRRVKIGAFGVLSVEQARAQAKKILASVALGGDPQAERREKKLTRNIDTFADVVDAYLSAKRGAWRTNTIVAFERYLTGDYFEALHKMQIDVVQRRNVAECIVRIEQKHGRVAAARARSALSAFYSWAIASGLAESNPVIGTLQPRDSAPRERVLTDSELRAVWLACDEQGDDFGRVVRLLILTGCRRNEITQLEWSDVDFANSTIAIPASRSKNKRAHTLTLPSIAFDVIKGALRIIGRSFVFGRSGRGYTNVVVAKAAIDRASSVTGWTLHDLRRSVATGMADIGIGPHVIEAVLNHVSGHRAGVAGVYNRSTYEREVRAALALWADHVRTLVEGGERTILKFPTGA